MSRVESDRSVGEPDRITVPDLDGVLLVGALHQADRIGFRLVIADQPADLRVLRSSGRWHVDRQEPVPGVTRFRGDIVLVWLRYDSPGTTGVREPRRPPPPRRAAQPGPDGVAEHGPG